MIDEPVTSGWEAAQASDVVEALTEWSLASEPLLPEDAEPLIPAMIGLKSGDVVSLGERLSSFAAETSAETKTAALTPKVLVPGIYREAASDGSAPGRGASSAARRGDEFFSILVNRAVLELLQHQTASTSPTHPRNDIFYIQHGAPVPEDALGPETTRGRVQLGEAGPQKGVVVTAIIDSGIPVLNARLRDAQGRSRVQYAWIQDAKTRKNDPSFVPHGREFDADDLNDLIDAYSTNGPYLDEVAAYRKMGLANFGKRNRHALGRQNTHGAHVVDLAAGYPMAENRTDRPVITVQLPHAVVADTSTSSLAPYFLSALDYIADRADRLAKRMGCGQLPLVINFSFGGTGGPLDGTSMLEQRMNAFLSARNDGHAGMNTIVLPSGNSRLSQTHAKVLAARDFKGADQTETLHWRVLPDDHTPSFVEVWTPKGPPSKQLEVAIGAPHGGPQSGFLKQKNGEAIKWTRHGKTIAKLSYRYYGAPTERGKFTIALQATTKLGKMDRAAPAGTWTVTLKDTGLAKDAHVDAWILRDDEVPGFDNDARQSRFEDPKCTWETPTGLPIDKDSGDCVITREGLQNVIATGTLPIVVGGYVDRSGQPARYSAGGYTNTPTRPGPDALAVSDDSRVHWGVLSAGVYSGARAISNGTSVSAPQVARKLADGLAAGTQATRAHVDQLAAASEVADFGSRAPKPAINRGGAGRIQLEPQNKRRYWPK